MGLLTEQILDALYGLKIKDEAGKWHVYGADGNEITQEFGIIGRGKMAALLFWPRPNGTQTSPGGMFRPGSQNEPDSGDNSYTHSGGTAVVGGHRRNPKKIDGFIDWGRILEPLPPDAWDGEEPIESGTDSGVAHPEEADKLPSQQLLQAVERVERLPGTQPLVAPDLQISPVAAARAAAEFDDEEALVMLLLEI